MGGALLWAVLMTLGIDGVRNLDLELVLDAAAHDLRDEGASGVALRELSQIGDATLGGAWSTFGLVVVLRTGSQTGLPTDDKKFSAFSARFARCPTHCHN